MPAARITPLRRTLQHAYFDRLGWQLAMQDEPADTTRIEAAGIPPKAAAILLSSGQGTDFNSVVAVTMAGLTDKIEAALAWIDDPATIAHLGDSLRNAQAVLALSHSLQPQ